MAEKAFKVPSLALVGSGNQLAVNAATNKIEWQGPQFTDTLAYESYVDQAISGVTVNVEVLAGNGLTYGAQLNDLNVNPGSGIWIDSDTVAVNTNVIATRAYVDAVAEGLHIHESVRAATTGPVALATDLEAGDTLDTNVTLIAGDRILVKNQATASENGIYVVQASGQPTRATDFDTATEVDSGDFVFVREGATLAGTGWVQVNQPATIGTDPIAFTQFSGAGTYTAGDGLDLTGNVFSVNAGLGIFLVNDAVNVNTNVIATNLAGNGLVTSGDGTTLDINPGLGIFLVNDAVNVNTNVIATNLAGNGLTSGDGTTLSVNPGTGIFLVNDAVNVNTNVIAQNLASSSLFVVGGTSLGVNTNVVAQSLVGTGLYVTSGDNLTVNTNALAGPLAGDALAITAGKLNVSAGLHLLVNTITNHLDVNARAVITEPSAGTATWVADSLNAYDYGATSFYIANNAAKSLRKINQAATQVSNTYVTVATIDFGGTANPTMFSADIVLTDGDSVRTSKISGTVNPTAGSEAANYTEYAIVEQGTAMSDVDVRVAWSGALSAFIIEAKASLPANYVLRGVAEVTTVGYWT